MKKILMFTLMVVGSSFLALSQGERPILESGREWIYGAKRAFVTGENDREITETKDPYQMYMQRIMYIDREVSIDGVLWKELKTYDNPEFFHLIPKSSPETVALMREEGGKLFCLLDLDREPRDVLICDFSVKPGEETLLWTTWVNSESPFKWIEYNWICEKEIPFVSCGLHYSLLEGWLNHEGIFKSFIPGIGSEDGGPVSPLNQHFNLCEVMSNGVLIYRNEDLYGFYFGWTGVDGIHEDHYPTGDTYSVYGTKVPSDYKGIVIRNGKKILNGF